MVDALMCDLLFGDKVKPDELGVDTAHLALNFAVVVEVLVKLEFAYMLKEITGRQQFNVVGVPLLRGRGGDF
jgi:hypothetical protein